jgi:uncharacterized protein YlbG (UPF0298 family)
MEKFKVVYITNNNSKHVKTFANYSDVDQFISKIQTNKLLRTILPILEKVNGKWITAK